VKGFLVMLSVAVAMLVAAPFADAKAPPTGKYECTIGDIFFGTITILPGGRYNHNGPHGTFATGATLTRFKDRIVGYTIWFKGGDLNNFKGRWHRASAGGGKTTYEIALRNPKDNFESIYCDRV